ncbi:UTP--glucose-1-phosphate uridylyltransferase [Actinocatenispora thailandica]|uniref:UTP--glucose-1-phosphate uridylyltransferase n=1 Tax=Actinocatenispora thailandica TaxID=227318 RepID=A0A7R7DJU9_9ACTN|nr:UTP--glucose-1-phosphate uridylyltransferase [Actinocatenispora thailandica]BCJ32923.1 UTP--glucose-1-phosphate uridylyltransferase [Actinocatenispora thailandica]
MPDHSTTSDPTAAPSADATPTQRATKAVIPAAGLATRFLPASKAVPKELFPVVDKPALQYIVEEAAAAGIGDVLLITGRGKSSMVDHFDRRLDLEAALEAKGDTERLEAVRRPGELAALHSSRQPEPLGLGHAVSCAEDHVGRSPFAVLLGDDLIDERDPLLPTMLDLQARTGGIVLALLEVPWSEVHKYGVASVEPAAESVGAAEIVQVTGLVEKPAREDAPSNLILVGRYVLPASIFDAIRDTEPDRRGEIQLTDAMVRLLRAGTPVHGVVFRGRRYDTGDPTGYLKAVVQLATARDDIGPDFREWLTRYVADGFTEQPPKNGR